MKTPGLASQIEVSARPGRRGKIFVELFLMMCKLWITPDHERDTKDGHFQDVHEKPEGPCREAHIDRAPVRNQPSRPALKGQKNLPKRRSSKMKVSKWDMAEFIDTKEDVIAHLAAALEENDTEFLLDVIGALARSAGMTQIARELGVTREGLYKSLSPAGNPSFETVLKLLDILGFRLRVEQKASA
jgi:probable addiction module antidote protein